MSEAPMSRRKSGSRLQSARAGILRPEVQGGNYDDLDFVAAVRHLERYNYSVLPLSEQLDELAADLGRENGAQLEGRVASFCAKLDVRTAHLVNFASFIHDQPKWVEPVPVSLIVFSMLSREAGDDMVFAPVGRAVDLTEFCERLGEESPSEFFIGAHLPDLTLLNTCVGLTGNRIGKTALLHNRRRSPGARPSP